MTDNPLFECLFKDGTVHQVSLNDLGQFAEDNADKIQTQKFKPRRRRAIANL
jgi:hypothetical protein